MLSYINAYVQMEGMLLFLKTNQEKVNLESHIHKIPKQIFELFNSHAAFSKIH